MIHIPCLQLIEVKFGYVIAQLWGHRAVLAFTQPPKKSP